VGQKELVFAEDWMQEGNIRVAITAGASTPNRVTGSVIERLVELRGESLDVQ